MANSTGPDDVENAASAEYHAAALPTSRQSRLYVALFTLCLAVAAAAIVTCRFAPRFVLWQGLYVAEDLPAPAAEFDRARRSLVQLDHPWAPVPADYHQVIGWRLLFPVLWHYSQLPRIWYLAVPQIGCVLALWLVAWLSFARLRRWWPTFFATILFAALPWFFVSSSWLLHFDSWLMIGLLAAAFVPSRFSLAAACLLTPWVDERFVLALPATLAVRAIALGRVEERQWRDLLLDAAVILAASLPYPTIRAMAWLHGDPNSTAYVQSHWEEVRTIAATRFAFGLWSGYRVGWLAVGAATLLAARRVGWRWAAAFALVELGTAVGGLFVAWDMSRSAMMIGPAFLLGIWLWDEWRAELAQAPRPRLLKLLAALVLPALAVGNLAAPAYHVLWSHYWEVEPLVNEIGKWRNPPRAFAATDHLLRGRKLAEQNNLPEALHELDAAIDTYDAYPQAYIERAVVQLRMGNAVGAEADINEALQQLPEYPFALLLRGALRLNRGEQELAADDIQHALSTAPADWPHRQEAQRLLGQIQGWRSADNPTR